MDVCFRLSRTCWRRRQAEWREKKKQQVDLSRALPCPIFSQIFSVFGNKDSCILNENCWVYTYGTRRWTCCRGPIIGCHIPGVKQSHPWCENTVSHQGVNVAASIAILAPSPHHTLIKIQKCKKLKPTRHLKLHQQNAKNLSLFHHHPHHLPSPPLHLLLLLRLLLLLLRHLTLQTFPRPFHQIH